MIKNGGYSAIPVNVLNDPTKFRQYQKYKSLISKWFYILMSLTNTIEKVNESIINNETRSAQ